MINIKKILNHFFHYSFFIVQVVLVFIVIFATLFGYFPKDHSYKIKYNLLLKQLEFDEFVRLDIKSLELFYDLEGNLFNRLDKRDPDKKIKLLSMSKKFHIDSLPKEYYPWMAYNKYEFVFNSNEPLSSDRIDALVIDTNEYLDFILLQYIKKYNDSRLNHIIVDTDTLKLRDKVCSTLKSKKGDFNLAGRPMEVSEFGENELIQDCAKQISEFATKKNIKIITPILNRSIANLSIRLKGGIAQNSGTQYDNTILANKLVLILANKNRELLLDQSKFNMEEVENNTNSNLHGFIMFFVFFMILLNILYYINLKNNLK